MARFGYFLTCEEHPPEELARNAARAEAAGFAFAFACASDHFHPWLDAQGHGSFVWSVLAAAAARTSTLALGTVLPCPIQRMPPAIVAQAAATSARLLPGRFFLGLGTGEALNEHVIGGYWPEAYERLERMWEAIEIIQKLFSGKDVKHRGNYFQLETCRLWTLPVSPPPIYVATAGPLTARKAGRLVDGIITPGAPEEKISMLLDRFDAGGRDGGRDPGSQVKVLQLHLSWASTDEQALANAVNEWPNGGMKFAKQDIRSPFDFEQMAKLVRPEDFDGRTLIAADPDAHRAEIQRYLDLGFDRVYLHNVGRNQAEWVEVFGREVLPRLTR